MNSLPQYAIRSDDELMRLALDSRSLTEEARGVLTEELRKRKLDTPDQLNRFVDGEKHHKHLLDIDIGDLVLIVPHGVGRRAYGQTNAEIIGTREEYDSTVFAVAFYFPLIPMGTYRFSREQNSKLFQVLEKKPLNWTQIMLVWLKAIAILIAIPAVFGLYLSLTGTH